VSTFTEVEDEHGNLHEVTRSPKMDARPVNPMFAAIPSLAQFDFDAYILERAVAYESEELYLDEAGMFMDDLITPVSVLEVLSWYASKPKANLEYADEYLANYADVKSPPPEPTLDILFGGLWTALEWTLVAAFDQLKMAERLPWQTSCSYCERRDGEVRKDRIGQRSCKRCWDTVVDGAW
jgi:hypothetical protein